MLCQAVAVVGREVRFCGQAATHAVMAPKRPWPNGYLLCSGCFENAVRGGQFPDCLAMGVRWQP